MILAGGGGARLGGADKASIEIGGRTLLETAIAACAAATEIVVVGEQVPTERPVSFLREDPPGGGPAAGLLAGLTGFARPQPWVIALAVDMPLVTPETISRLAEAADGDGAVLFDGRRQYLCAVYRTAALQPTGEDFGRPMKTLIGGLDLVDVPAVGREARDVDSWEDLEDLR